MIAQLRATYTRIRELGRGGEGSVWLASGPSGQVAVKVLRVDDPDLRDSFRREIHLTRALAGPNVIEVLDSGIDEEGRPFYVMPYFDEAETLDEVIYRLEAGDEETHAAWPMERRVRVLRDVCRALRGAHERGVIHRDVKPSNILLGGRDEVRLIDWGMAYVDPEGPLAAEFSAEPAGAEGLILGTPLYMAPEQLHSTVTRRADVYSLTAAFYELLTLSHYLGEPAWELNDLWRQILKQEPEAVDAHFHSQQGRVPSGLAPICARGLAKAANERQADAGELEDALDTWLTETSAAGLFAWLASRWPRQGVDTSALTFVSLLLTAVLMVGVGNLLRVGSQL